MEYTLCKKKLGLITAVFFQVIDRGIDHDPSYPPTQLTGEAELMQILKYHYKSFLQNIFCIDHGFGIAIAYPQHCPRKMLIQPFLSSRIPSQTVFYQLVIIHSFFVTLTDN